MSNNSKSLLGLRGHQLRSKIALLVKKVTTQLDARPLLSFILLLAMLIGVVIVANIVRRPSADADQALAEPIPTTLFSVGGATELVVQAQIEKTGVIKLVALTSGIVQKVHVTEGQAVSRGGRIVSLSSTYQGSNIASLSRQISQKNYQSIVDNYQLQLDSIEANKQMAEKGETQQSTLRQLSRYSFDETRRIIELNENIFDTLNEQLDQAIATGQPVDQINVLKGQVAGQLSALSGLRASLRSSEYLNSDSEEPADMARITKENTLRQLELQRRALELNKEIASLNLKLAQVSESLMFPTSPCAGQIERVYVTPGQVVSPGTPLALLKANDGEVSAVALVSSEVAHQVSLVESAIFSLHDKDYFVTPRSVSSEATDGVLHSVVFSLPAEISADITRGSSVDVKLPLSLANQAMSVPVDAIYQSATQSYVLIAVNQGQELVAESREVVLGEIFGSNATIVSGLTRDDKVILNRQVMSGDRILAK